MVKDYLGSEITIGVRGIRVHSYGHSKDFKKITVKEIDETRKYGDIVGIITDGNSKIGWTYPMRIIVQPSLSVII
jgi:hypothetical protein